jgi:hypothetical protein
MVAVAPNLRLRLPRPGSRSQQAQAAIAEFGLGGRELADGVVLVRAGQGATLRKEHLLPGELVTFATGADVQMSGPRVREFRGEEALLARFLAVSDPRRTVVCATQGHGEPALDSLEPYSGQAHLRDLLRDAARKCASPISTRPRGCAAAICCWWSGPQGPLPPAQVQAVERFAAAGGDILLLAGAVILRGRSQLAPHGLEALAARYGVRFGERVVVDPSAMAGATPLLAFTLRDGWGEHPASASLVGQPVSLLQVRELELEAPATFLMQTTDEGWAEADVAGFGRGELPVLAEPADRRGPLPVAAAAERGGARA